MYLYQGGKFLPRLWIALVWEAVLSSSLRISLFHSSLSQRALLAYAALENLTFRI